MPVSLVNNGMRRNRRTVKFDNSVHLSKLLVQWLYIEAVVTCIVEATGMGSLQILHYVAMAIQIARVASSPNFIVSKSVAVTLSLVLAYSAISVFLVPNNDYYAVLIDAIPALLIWLPCMLVVSQPDFRFDTFCLHLGDAVRWMSLFVLAMLPLRLGGVISYGAISHPATINALGLLLYFAIRGRVKGDRVALAAFVTNAVIVFLFGGRSFAFALGIATLGLWLVLGKKSLGKLLRLILLIGLLSLVFFNLDALLSYLQTFLAENGIRSRNLTLLINQLSTSELYLASRDVVYQVAIDIIGSHNGLPAGFGVIRAATDGAYYHPHNIILQLVLLFGYVGAVLFLLFAISRLCIAQRLWGLKSARALLALAIFYTPYSLFNGSILAEPIAVLLFASLFFMSCRREPSASFEPSKQLSIKGLRSPVSNIELRK